jgi:hypothetical protein
MAIDIAYLQKLAKIENFEIPLIGDFNVDESEQTCYDYCQLRNAAKDLLYFNPTDKKTEKKLSNLVVKLSRINLN